MTLFSDGDSENQKVTMSQEQPTSTTKNTPVLSQYMHQSIGTDVSETFKIRKYNTSSQQSITCVLSGGRTNLGITTWVLSASTEDANIEAVFYSPQSKFGKCRNIDGIVSLAQFGQQDVY